MADLGLQAYRFSIAWPRVMPDGSGAAEPRRPRLLLAAGRRAARAPASSPSLTLYHWDLPQALQDAGGWTEPRDRRPFAEYAELVAARLGDRVGTWTTLNEPWCAAYLGYASGAHAPGRTDAGRGAAAVHHLMLAHGLAVAAHPRRGTRPATRRSRSTRRHVRAASDSPADLDAVRHVDGITNRIFLDPLLRGSYPDDVVEDLRHVTDWSFVADGDLATIGAPIDVLGVNYYNPHARQGGRADEDLPLWPGSDHAFELCPSRAAVHRDGLADRRRASFTELLDRLGRDYPGVPMMITENGAAFDDVVDRGRRRARRRPGRLPAQPSRRGARRDRRPGVDMRGYFVWSLMDNFEWALGLSKRFGIVHVDYDTQQRRLKDSARWYSAVIAANGLP